MTPKQRKAIGDAIYLLEQRIRDIEFEYRLGVPRGRARENDEARSAIKVMREMLKEKK